MAYPPELVRPSVRHRVPPLTLAPFANFCTGSSTAARGNASSARATIPFLTQIENLVRAK